MMRNKVGVHLNFETELNHAKVLFNEAPAFVLEVSKECFDEVNTALLNTHYELLGDQISL